MEVAAEKALSSPYTEVQWVLVPILAEVLSVVYFSNAVPWSDDHFVSQRIPAAHCGLYGLKPSNGRLPHAGLMGSHDGMEAIIGSLGPIASSARDLSLFCRTMLQYEPWKVEPPLFEIPWKDSILDGVDQPDKLAIAIIWDDGVVAPHPPIIEALRKTQCALRAAGHDVISWDPLDNHQFAWDLIVSID